MKKRQLSTGQDLVEEPQLDEIPVTARHARLRQILMGYLHPLVSPGAVPSAETERVAAEIEKLFPCCLSTSVQHINGAAPHQALVECSAHGTET